MFQLLFIIAPNNYHNYSQSIKSKITNKYDVRGVQNDTVFLPVITFFLAQACGGYQKLFLF